MRFLADESCDFAVVRVLRGVGHDVAAVRDLSRGAADDVVIEIAVRENRILSDGRQGFWTVGSRASGKSPWCNFHSLPGNARQALTEAIMQLVAMGEEKIKGKFIVVQPGRIRVS